MYFSEHDMTKQEVTKKAKKAPKPQYKPATPLKINTKSC